MQLTLYQLEIYLPHGNNQSQRWVVEPRIY